MLVQPEKKVKKIRYSLKDLIIQREWSPWTPLFLGPYRRHQEPSGGARVLPSRREGFSRFKTRQIDAPIKFWQVSRSYLVPLAEVGTGMD